MDLNLISKSKCGTKEKNKMIKLISEIIAMSNIARRRGLIALDDVIHVLSCDLLKIGVRLITAGIDPAMIEETMLKIIHAENFKGTELFERLMVIEGIKAIQLGDNNAIAKIRLFSMFGEKTLCEILQDSSKIDLKLKKYNPFKSPQCEVNEDIKITSEPGTFKSMKYAFNEILKSLSFLEFIAGVYLFKANQEALSNLISSTAYEQFFIILTLEPVIQDFKDKSLSIDELKELASLIKSNFNDNESVVLALNNALRQAENFQTEYRNKNIIEYEAEFRHRGMEFFKVILSLMTEKRNLFKLNESFLRNIITYTIVDGKTAINFVEENKIVEIIKKRSISEILQSIF